MIGEAPTAPEPCCADCDRAECVCDEPQCPDCRREICECDDD